MSRTRVKSDDVYREIIEEESVNPFHIEDKDKWTGSRTPQHRSVDAKEYFDSIRNNRDYTFSLENNPFNTVNSLEDIRNNLRHNERTGAVEQVKADIAASQSLRNLRSFGYVNEETYNKKPEEYAGTEVYVDLDSNAKRLYDNLRNGYTIDDFVRSNIEEKRKMKLSQESKHTHYNVNKSEDLQITNNDEENLKSIEAIIEQEIKSEEDLNLDLTHEYDSNLQIDTFNKVYDDEFEKTSILEDILNSGEVIEEDEDETKIEEILDASTVERLSSELDQTIKTTDLNHLEYTRENENLIELIRERKEKGNNELTNQAIVEELKVDKVSDKKAKKEKKEKEPRRKVDIVIEIGLFIACIVLLLVFLNQNGVKIPFLP